MDLVAAASVAPGVRPIGENDSIDQRALPTVRFLEEERRMLVQVGCLDTDPPPPELIEFYGVRAQMLGSLLRGDHLLGWISVHHIPGPRKWSDADTTALEEAVRLVKRELGDAG